MFAEDNRQQINTCTIICKHIMHDLKQHRDWRSL